jgi:hypothetical protein
VEKVVPKSDIVAVVLQFPGPFLLDFGTGFALNWLIYYRFLMKVKHLFGPYPCWSRHPDLLFYIAAHKIPIISQLQNVLLGQINML